MVLLLPGSLLLAAQQETVLWQFSLDPTTVRRGEIATVHLSATPQYPWYVYAHTVKGGGPTPMRFRFDLPTGIRAVGAIEAPPPGKKFDKGFEMEVEYYDEPVEFRQKFVVGDEAALGPAGIKGTVRYQSCNESVCMPPKDVTFDLLLTVESGAPREAFRAPVGTTTSTTSTPAGAPPPPARQQQSPSPAPAQSVAQAMQSGLLAFLLLAIVQGFLALTTPCVYPMIPITVSFFLKQGEHEGRRPVALALTYAVSIIVTFTAIGLLMAAIYGPAGTSRLGSSPVANLILALFFIAFALSLFGLFEIEVPASLQNYFARRGRGGGYGGTIFMGVAFTLASLACTAPFVGALLGLAAGGQWFWPLVGMLAFSFAFSLPFFVLALFPQFLARMPKSGGWLNSVKVVMGFLILAVSLKFVENADAVWKWEILTRPVLLATWTTIAVFAGVYLLGLIRLPHDTPLEHIGVVRMLFSLAFLTFGLYLAYGLFGGKINGTLDSFLPAPEIGQTGQVGQIGPVGQVADRFYSLRWLDDYGQALEQAKAQHKPILIDFTGVTCTNCRWMERNVFVRPDVAQAMKRFVLVRLQTDNGPHWRENQQMQVKRFGTAALPFYAVMSPDDRELARSAGVTRDAARFIAFLDEGFARPEP
jgi:thiol:disulfide interchange protein DsbD